MLDVLLPSTDTGVALQFVAVLVATAVGVWFAPSRDVRRLALGLGLLLTGLMAVRAIH